MNKEEIDFFDIERNDNFDIYNFLINLSFHISETKNDIVKYSVLVHEYTHYLQSLGTVSGIIIVLDFFDFIVKIHQDLSFKIPNNIEFYTDFLTEYSEDYENLKQRFTYNLTREISDTNISDYTLKEDVIKHDFFYKEITEYFITLEGKEYHISYKCLRETMATMTMFLARKFTKEEAIDYLEKMDTEKKWYYKILFLYLASNYPNIDDIILFTYYFTELSLQSSLPAENLGLLFTHLKTYSKEQSIDTLLFFNSFAKNNKQVFEIFPKIKNVINKKMKDYYSLSKNMELFSFFVKYLERSIKAFDILEKRPTYFPYFRDSLHFQKLISLISSPVIIQTDSNDIRKVSTLDEQQDYSLALLFGMSLFLNSYIKNDFSPRTSKCIFIDEVPICQLYKTASDPRICYHEPYKIKPFPTGNCLFYNANLVLAMLEDEEIKKYKKN